MGKKKTMIYSGFAGILAYFLGSIVYELFFKNLFGENKISKAIVIVFTVVIVGVLTYFYLKNKYPELTKELEILEKDERGQLIRGKTSTYTLVFIAIISTIIFTYAYIKDQMFLSYMIAGGYVLTILFNSFINSYLSKRN